MLLCGCDKPAVSGCEDFIVSQLKAPSTYKRIDVSESDDPTPYAEMVRLGMIDTSAALRRFVPNMDIKLNEPDTLHKVLVTYEANNSFNAPLRGAAVCAFPTQGTKDGLDKDTVQSAVIHAKASAALRALKPDQPEPEYPCCL